VQQKFESRALSGPAKKVVRILTFDPTPNNSTTIMANAADKARFFLEQQIPELREFETKKIFTSVSPSS
jgi:hypothetical protein